jgi:outer membrane protein
MKRILTAVLFMLFACNAYADNPLKIGVVSLNAVIQGSALSQSLSAKLSADFKPRQDAINAAQKKLQDDSEQLIFEGFKMSDAERAKLQSTVAADRRALDNLNSSLQSDFSAAQAQATQTLMAKLNAVISKIASDGKYDIIQTNANMLYLNGSIDITKQVIEQLK